MQKIYQLIRETFPDYSFEIVDQSGYRDELEKERARRTRQGAESGPGPYGEVHYRVRELEVPPKKRSPNKLTNYAFSMLEFEVERDLVVIMVCEDPDEDPPWARVER